MVLIFYGDIQNCTSNFKLYTSLNGEKWEDIGSFTLNTYGTTGMAKEKITPVRAKFIKIEMTEFNNGWDGGKALIFRFNTYGMSIK